MSALPDPPFEGQPYGVSGHTNGQARGGEDGRLSRCALGGGSQADGANGAHGADGSAAPGEDEQIAPYRLSASRADAAAERQLREELRVEVGGLLGVRQLLSPGKQESDDIRALIRQRIGDYQRNAANRNLPLLADPKGLEQRLFDTLLRLGPLQSLMDDAAVEEVICDSCRDTYVVVDGHKRAVEDQLFESDDELYQLVKRVVGPLGRRLDESSPMVDCRLPDGSRLNAVIPPISLTGCCVTIRKFVLKAQTLPDLVRLSTLPAAAAQFLDAAVRAGVNIVVSGGTAAGKTTMLNAFGSCITSRSERIVTIEETSELALVGVRDWVALQARAPNAEGVGEVTIRDLVRNALRMRPSRIIVGEVRSGECWDMLQAMNTGHDGSMTTVHANSPRDALDKLATLALIAPEKIGIEALTRMIARTIHLVVQLRFEPRTKKRRLVSIFEVTGLEGTVITGNELWKLAPDGSRLEWTGIQPRCLAKIAASGVPYALPPATPATRSTPNGAPTGAAAARRGAGAAE